MNVLARNKTTKSMHKYWSEYFAETLHTGLRKGLDSTWSSLAWNVVHVCPKAWIDLCDDASKAIKAGELPIQAIQNWCESHSGVCEQQHRVLKLTFDLMSALDASSIHEWFVFCYESSKGE